MRSCVSSRCITSAGSNGTERCPAGWNQAQGRRPAITAGQQSQTHAAKIRHGGGDPPRAFQWASLSRFLDDGSTEIANNAAERAIRPMGSDAKTVCSPYQIGVVNRQPPLGS
ncbi:IS66 family transposase [Agrobacterium tumefaciens]|uniref:IS66 family transposase n=1 Tax=Agrobacterium tumefaciens TaxID=358 RepID=UPI00129A6F4A|nr:transposase [Agrobacterium tumefaciens]